jgi:sulfatase modifying factor 1
MKKTFAILLLAVLFVGSALQAQDVAKPELRTWKDSTGQFRIQATFVRVNGDLVVLQGIDKKEISLPLAKLSAADQQYVKARLTSVSNATKTITNTIGMKLNLIPAGTFIMGYPEIKKDKAARYGPQHKVTISKPFYMQTTEVTQSQWKAVLLFAGVRGDAGELWKDKDLIKEGVNYPATYVNWNDAVAFCKILSEKEGKTYRLPTEAEWEYACRAGTKTAWSFGDDAKVLGDYAWFHENTLDIGEKFAHEVGLKKPNAFGLFDMHGNVREWCHDSYVEDYYKQSPELDPQGPMSGTSRVVRGGTYTGNAYHCCSYTRSTNAVYFRWNFIGFRVVRELD